MCITHDEMILQSGKCVDFPERVGHYELVEEQEKYEFCVMIRGRLETGEELPFQITHNGLLLRLSPAGHQIVVPKTLTKRILHPAYYTPIGDTPEGEECAKLYGDRTTG